MMGCLRLVLLIVFLLSLAPEAKASAIQVSPIRLQLLADQKIASLEITNQSEETLVLKVQGVRWIRRDGQDIHEDTKDIFVTPPMAKIEPHETQLIRIGFLVPRDPKKGGTYRIIINEILQSAISPTSGIKTILEIRVPLLVDPLSPSAPSVTFSARREGDKKIKLEMTNRGESHLILRKISLQEEGQQNPLVEKQIFDYVIPSQSKEWELELSKPFVGKSIHVLADTEQGEASSLVQLSP